MVIDTNNIGPAQSGTTRNSETDSSAARSAVSNDNNASSRGNTSDTVELSSQARDFDRVRESLQNVPEVDRARVDSIKQQIADGSYQIDTDLIAANILSDDQNFIL